MTSPKKAKREKANEQSGEEKGILKLFKGICERNVDETLSADVSGDRLIDAASEDDWKLAPVLSQNRKRSIFAQRFSNLKDQERLDALKHRTQCTHHESTVVNKNELTAMDWSPDGRSEEMKSIDEENQMRIAGMTEEQILDEQRSILESSDPLMSVMASYLKNRKQKNEVSKGTKEDAVNDKSYLKRNAKVEVGFDDLPVKPKPEWINMHQMEPEKLAWMKDLPLPSADNQQTGQPARFDFAGNLVSPELEIPVHLGLHHHGDEPERAGYSLQELFQLSRSTNLQQRVIALTTMGRVIRNARRGEFHGRLSASVIPCLLDGGVVFLMRWALDDGAQTSVAASVDALHSLIVCNEDEVAADKVFFWDDGTTMPSFQHPVAEEEKNSEEERPETDADVVRKDVVKGLLRMCLPERLRYLLEVCRPAASVVIQIFEILIRLVRHSSEAAYQVFKCPRLIDVIMHEFLPSTWSPQFVSEESLPNVYGFPLSTAIKLVRVLCSAGRNIADSLLSKYNILRYVVEEPSQMDLPHDIALRVSLESWCLWIVLLKYGLTLDIYCNLYHFIMERLRKLSVSEYPVESRSLSLGCVYLGVVEATVHCAAEVSLRLESSRGRSGILELGDLRPTPVVPSFNWSPVTGLFPLFSGFCLKSLQHFTDFYFDQPYDLDLVTSSVNLLASYYGRIRDQPQYNPLSVENEVLALCSDHLMPCFKSRSFSLSLQNVRNYSLFESERVNCSESSSDSLKTLEAVSGAVTCPLLEPRSTVAFLVSLSRLLIALGKLSQSIIEKAFCLLLNHEETLEYVRKVCRIGSCSFSKNYFSRFERQFQFYLVQMALMKALRGNDCVDVVDMSLYHFLALNLLLHLNSGEEFLCHSLLSSVLFNIEFLRDLSSSEEMESEFFEDCLRLNVSEPLTNATQQKFRISKSDLSRDLRENLSSMRSTYLTSAPVDPARLVQSRNRWLGSCLDRSSLLSGVLGQSLVPLDWVFLPLIQVYNGSLDPNVLSDDRLSPRLVMKVKNCLRTFFLLEVWRPDALKDISVTVKLCRLMFTFLAGSDLFLDELIHSYLAELLKLYSVPKVLDRIDFTMAIPGIPSIHDLYRQFVAQFEAVSFGDSLFACYLLLPLQQQHSVSLRVVLWDENVAALRSIFISVKELIIPIERFLEPEETETRLLRLYFQALFSRTVIPTRCPLLYLMAVHHVNRFIYVVENTHQKLQHDMMRELLASSNEELKHDLLYYKSVNVDCSRAFELYDELPAERQKTVGAVQESRSLT